MPIDRLKDRIPDFVKDVRLNLAWMMATKCCHHRADTGCCWRARSRPAISTVTAAMESAACVVTTPAAVEAAKSAASVMAMSNVYYRFVHLASNPEYRTMPARLRMNWVGTPRVDRTDFEL